MNNEIYVPVNPDPDALLVFDRTANGDVAPKRILAGPDTQLRGSAASAVDPIHNLLMVNVAGAMLIFDRTASGNTKPKAVIRGPNSGMARIDSFQVIPERGLILAGGQGGFIGAWSINDNGDVPPRWKIPVQQLTGYVASGIAVDPVHKEIILSAAGQRVRTSRGIMNTVITFSWPEIF